MDTLQQSLVNEEWKMSFKKEKRRLNDDIFFLQSLFPAK